MPLYWLVKQAHMGFAVISISLFLVRALWSVQAPHRLQTRWAKICPHINDSLLLACGLYLAISAGWSPFVHPWLAAKLAALLLYIGCGNLVLKRARTPKTRFIWALMATAIFGYMVLIAFTKTPLPLQS